MRAAPLTIGLIAISLAFAGCSGDADDASDEPGADAAAELVIHRPFRSGPGSVNSYWLLSLIHI